jgi:hypothetical protein
MSARDFDTTAYRSAHVLELLRDAHKALADDVMLRAARLTATGHQLAAIVSQLEEAIETTRQLSLEHCRGLDSAPVGPSTSMAGPYLRQRVGPGWQHVAQSPRKPAAQVGVSVPL